MKLSDGALLTVLTATAYLVAFAHEVGSVQAFGLPLELINLQLLPALFATAVSLAGLVILFQAIDPIVDLLTPKIDEHPVVRALSPVFGLAVVFFAFWLVGGRNHFGKWWIVPLLLISWGVLSLALPMLYRLPGGYLVNLRASQQINAELQGPVNRMLFGSAGSVTVLVLVALLLMALSYTAGSARASRQKIFFVTTQANNPNSLELVVLRIYGDRLIAAEFVRNEKRIKRVYRVLKLDGDGLVLRQETVGPLKVDN